MSIYEAWIATNTQRTLDEVHQWHGSLPGWTGDSPMTGHRRVFRTTDDAVTSVVIDSGNYRPGSAYNNYRQLGSAHTLIFDIYVQRKKTIGRLDDIYTIAFGFCQWDADCNVLLTMDDGNVGVFLRRDGIYYINTSRFYASSLASFLTFPYQLPDDPQNELRKQEWPETPN